jgi:hypothetical protein
MNIDYRDVVAKLLTQLIRDERHRRSGAVIYRKQLEELVQLAVAAAAAEKAMNPGITSPLDTLLTPKVLTPFEELLSREPHVPDAG